MDRHFPQYVPDRVEEHIDIDLEEITFKKKCFVFHREVQQVFYKGKFVGAICREDGMWFWDKRPHLRYARKIYPASSLVRYHLKNEKVDYHE